MKLEEIENFWDQDSKINPTNISEESLKIPKLHNKYYQILLKEKLLYHKLESEYKTLFFNKREFYCDGPNEETPKDWKLPSKGRILKQEVNFYLEADKDLIEAGLKISYQKEKISFLVSILETIQFRNNSIKNHIEIIKFQNGIG